MLSHFMEDTFGRNIQWILIFYGMLSCAKAPEDTKLNGSATKTKGKKNGLHKPDPAILLSLEVNLEKLRTADWLPERMNCPATFGVGTSKPLPKNFFPCFFLIERNYIFIVDKTILTKSKIQIFGNKQQENLSQNIV